VSAQQTFSEKCSEPRAVLYRGITSDPPGGDAVPRPEPASSSCAQPEAPLARRTQAASLIWPNGRFAGRLRYDAVVNGRMHVLSTWLLTTSNGQVAARIATLLGRQPHIDRAGSEQVYRVFSGHAEIDVLLDGPHVIRLLMLRRNGSDVLRNCNGRVQRTLSGMQPCQCPPTLKGRWEIAKAGAGCEPQVQVAVRLAADPTLGHFLLSSATWVFADHAIALKGALNRRIDMPVLARLLVDHTLHSTRSGTTFAFTRPTITVLPTA
jgi:hypothetical protein